jgi:hypothetical protein
MVIRRWAETPGGIAREQINTAIKRGPDFFITGAP